MRVLRSFGRLVWNFLVIYMAVVVGGVIAGLIAVPFASDPWRSIGERVVFAFLGLSAFYALLAFVAFAGYCWVARVIPTRWLTLAVLGPLVAVGFFADYMWWWFGSGGHVDDELLDSHAVVLVAGFAVGAATAGIVAGSLARIKGRGLSAPQQPSTVSVVDR